MCLLDTRNFSHKWLFHKPSVFSALFVICSIHDNESVKYTPKYLYDNECSSGCESNKYWVSVLVEDLIMDICLHLRALMFICSREHHDDIVSKSSWTIL